MPRPALELPQPLADSKRGILGCGPVAREADRWHRLRAGLSLSRKVFRWYTDCCRTPIANTVAGPRFPVAALIHSFMDPGSEGRLRDEMLGPPLCRIYERSAIGPLPPTAPARLSLGVFARRALKILG